MYFVRDTHMLNIFDYLLSRFRLTLHRIDQYFPMSEALGLGVELTMFVDARYATNLVKHQSRR